VRSAFVLRILSVTSALMIGAGTALAGAPGHPGSGTSAPAVPLSADQQGAIAAKDAQRVAHERAMAERAPGAQAMQFVDGKLVPVVGVEPARAAATRPERLKLPTISPAIGVIPRPEWRLPPQQPPKPPDVAVIGDRRVRVTAGAPAAASGKRP
jgi:hypothetical protein